MSTSESKIDIQKNYCVKLNYCGQFFWEVAQWCYSIQVDNKPPRYNINFVIDYQVNYLTVEIDEEAKRLTIFDAVRFDRYGLGKKHTLNWSQFPLVLENVEIKRLD